MYALAQVDRTQSEWSLSRTQGRLDAGHDVDLLETGTPHDLLHPIDGLLLSNELGGCII